MSNKKYSATIKLYSLAPSTTPTTIAEVSVMTRTFPFTMASTIPITFTSLSLPLPHFVLNATESSLPPPQPVRELDARHHQHTRRYHARNRHGAGNHQGIAAGITSAGGGPLFHVVRRADVARDAQQSLHSRRCGYLATVVSSLRAPTALSPRCVPKCRAKVPIFHFILHAPVSRRAFVEIPRQSHLPELVLGPHPASGAPLRNMRFSFRWMLCPRRSPARALKMGWTQYPPCHQYSVR